MPIRSNRFQKLVHMLERQLSGKANVRQSVELADRDTGKNREVDVVIDIQSGHHQLRIGLEATSGRGGTPWVESMICKHQLGGLSNKLILVAEQGFTQPAMKKARMHDVDVVVLEEAESLDWTKLVGKYAELWFAKVDLSPKEISLTAEAILDSSEPGITAEPETQIISADGTRKITLIQLVHRSLREAHVLKQVYDREDREELTTFDVDLTPGEDCYVLDNDGNPRRVLRIHVKGSLQFSIVSFEVKNSSYRDAAIGYGEFEIDGKKALAAIVEEPGSAPKVSVNFSETDNDPGKIIDLDSPGDER